MNAREDWLLARRAGLGGSDIGAILGLSKYRTPVDVWMEKTGRTPGQEETLQMRFGTYAEEFVAREYCAQTGRAVQRYTNMLHHKNAPVLGNVDRLVVPEGAKIASHKGEIRTELGLECKTASAFAAYNADEWGEAGTDAVPMSYLVQCATYMALTGCPLWDLAVLFGNQEVRIYNLKRDQDLEGEIIARATEWWNRYVVADIAPDPTSEEDTKKLFPRDNGKAIEITPQVLVAFERLRSIKSDIKALEEDEQAQRDIILPFMADATELSYQGTTLATWKAPKPGKKTDWKAAAEEVAALIPIGQQIIENHTKTVEGSRRFLLK